MKGSLFDRIKKKRQEPFIYDKENWQPVLRCSICNGEQVAGFKNIHTGQFKEESVIRNQRELEQFKSRCQVRELKKEY